MAVAAVPAGGHTRSACEAILAMHTGTFVDVGQALIRILKADLYRMEFKSFDDYCRQKWEFGPRTAYYLMAAAEVFTHLCTNCADRKPERVSPSCGPCCA